MSTGGLAAVGRWPVHPRPARLESLSSWVDRLCVIYGLSSKDLFGSANLEFDSTSTAYVLDVDPPHSVLTHLAQRTGTDVDQLRAMTYTGWTPCLFEQVYPTHGDRVGQVFYTYVRCNSVLLPYGGVPLPHYTWLKRWGGPWQPSERLNRCCPVCVTDPDRGTRLVWQLPLVLGCGEHGCYLEEDWLVSSSMLLHGEPVQPRPLPEPMATLERYTHTALTTGLVALPGRTVHAAVWFRLLRSLIDEVSLAISPRNKVGRETLRRIWAATGLIERAGLKMWQPYEVLDAEHQHHLMFAAATALDLATTGQILAVGRLGDAIQPRHDQRVYDGDRPPAPTAWQEALADVENLLLGARTDPEVARNLLACLTAPSRSRATFERHRELLFGAGIPATFLPTAAELGRTDLTN